METTFFSTLFMIYKYIEILAELPVVAGLKYKNQCNLARLNFV
jgi:hypothetical protein